MFVKLSMFGVLFEEKAFKERLRPSILRVYLKIVFVED